VEEARPGRGRGAVEGSSSRELVSEGRTVLLTGRHAADWPEAARRRRLRRRRGAWRTPYRQTVRGRLDAGRQEALGFASGGRLEHGTAVWVGELTGRRWRGWGWPASSEDGVVGGAGAGLR
jgi:hypothetical protein